MSNNLRAWIAGLGLAFSAIVLISGSDPRGVGTRAVVGLTVILAHAWVVAVGERSGTTRSGMEIKRWPLGPRLVRSQPGLFGQLVVIATLLGVGTADWTVAGAAFAAVLVLSLDVLRRALPYILPAAGAIYALLTMEEFHTLGDLVTTAKGWGISLLWLGVWCLVVFGPMLRADAGGRFTPSGKLVLMIAALPGYIGGVWVFSQTSLRGFQPDMLALGLALLAGGTVQAFIVSFLGKTADIGERATDELPPVNGHDVGMAMLPLVLPVLTCLALLWLPLDAVSAGHAAPEAWVGVFVLLMIVPAVPAAGLVASGLDRAEGISRGWVGAFVSVSVLGVWLLFGPSALDLAFSQGGAVMGLRELFPMDDDHWIAISGIGDGTSMIGPYLGGKFTLYGLPAADLCRAVTLMFLAAATLSARQMRHARIGLVGPGWGSFVLTVVLQGVGCWMLMPRIGPVGAALATVAACVVMLVVDVLTGERIEQHEQPDFGFEGIDDAVEEDEFDAPPDPVLPDTLPVGPLDPADPASVPDVAAGPPMFEDDADPAVPASDEAPPAIEAPDFEFDPHPGVDPGRAEAFGPPTR